MNYKIKNLIKIGNYFEAPRRGLGGTMRVLGKIILPTKNLSKRNKKILAIFSLAAIAIMVPIITYSLLHLRGAEAAWFNDNWGYRQTVNISNSGSAQTDYQVVITLDTATLITNGKMQANCNDIRITDINGKLLPFWIETGTTGAGGKACNASTTQIWTKVASIPTSGQTVYLYYGNPSATNTQSGDKVFEFFDDFSGYSLGALSSGGKWTWESSKISPTIVNDSGTKSLRLQPQSSAEGPILFNQGTVGNTIIQARIRDANNAHYHIGRHSGLSSPVGDTGQGFWIYPESIHLFRNNAGYSAWTDINSTSRSVSITTYHNYKVTANGSSWAIYEDGASSPTHSGTEATYSSGYPALMTYSGEDIYVDFFFVRTFATTEPSVASPTNEEKSPAPVAYWKFDEGTGTVANDSSSNKNNGTLVNSPTWQAENQCISGKCLYFDGSNNSYVDAGNNWNFATTDSFTVSTWFKTTSLTSEQTIITKGQNATCFNYAYLIQPNGSIMFGNTSGQDTIIPAGKVSVNTWYHFEAVYVNGSVTGYLNGIAYTTASRATSTCTNSIKIGSAGGGRLFKGFIDEPKIYSYARTAAQIKTDFASRGSVKGVSTSIGASDINKNLSNGLVGYWKMDESSGNAADSSGNSNTGTWYGTGTSHYSAGKFGNGGGFNGTDDRITVSNTLSSIGTGDFSVSTWIKNGSNTTWGRIVHTGCIGYTNGMFLARQGSSSSIAFATCYNSSAASSFVPATINTYLDGNWHHVVVSVDRSKTKLLRMYVDGINVSIAKNNSGECGTISSDQLSMDISSCTSATTQGDNLTIGNDSSSEAYAGSIDEARIYNRVLSPVEVSQLYNFAPGPVAYYNFEEGSGGTVNDKSGNSNNGTWSGIGSHWVSGKYGKGGIFIRSNTDFINAGTSNIPSGSSARTFEGWINPSNNGGVFIGTNTASGQKYFVEVANVSGTWYLFTDGVNGANNITLTGSEIPSLSQWSYIAFTLDNSNGWKYYLNGKFVKGGTFSVSINTGTPASTYIGNRSDAAGYSFDGKMDEVRIYNYARTSGQIVEDMNAGHPNVGSPVGSAVGHWKFDEGYGITANNSGNVGNILKGTLANMSSPAISTSGWSQSGKFGKAISFDGTNDYVDMGNPSALQITGSMIISAWVNPTNTTNNWGIVSKFYNTAGNRGYNFGIVGGYLSFRGSVDGTASVTSQSIHTIPNNIWSYVAVAYDASAGTATFYINGKLDVVRTGQPNSIYNSPVNFTIGSWDSGTGHVFMGVIDEVKLYNYALTADEIKLDMNHGASQVLGSTSDTSGLTGGSVASNSASAAYCIPGDTSACNSPVGEWNFEEKTGPTANDTSGTNNAGTISGASWTQGKIGSGLNHNGSSDYAYAQIGSWLGVSNIPWTVSAWFNSPSSGGPIFGVASSPPGGGWNMPFLSMDTSANIYAYAWGGGQISCASSFESWHYAEVVYDPSAGLKLYIDGNLCNSSSNTTYSASGAIDYWTTYISGAKPANVPSYFKGKIDQVRIYNYARSAAQTAYDYNRGAPVGHWKFDECQGLAINDSSGNGNIGTITIGGTGAQTTAGTCTTSGTAWGNGATGKYNASLNFDGADDYVSIPYNAVLDQINTVTLSAWIKYTTTANKVIIEKSNNNTHYQFQVFDSSQGSMLGGELVFMLQPNSSNWVVAKERSNDGQWHHVVGTYDRTINTARIYIDGVLKNTNNSITTGPTSNSSPLLMGSRSGVGGFGGSIDDVRIYNYALTPTQVKQVMNQGAGVRFGPQTGAP